MIMNQKPYPISFELQVSQALVCRYGEKNRQYRLKPDIDVSDLSCLLQIVKTDGTFTENGVDVVTDPESGECTLVATIPQQATVVKGLNRYSICCYDEDILLYSAEGPLWVDDALITEEMIQSVAEVNGYTFPQDFFTIDMIPDIVEQIIPLVTAEILDDDSTSDSTTWSSTKIHDEIEQAAGATSLGDLSDVSITDPQEDDTIIYDPIGENWKNAPVPGHVYSTSEHVVGKWIDGSVVYEKTLECGALPSNSDKTVAHGVGNLRNIISCVGYSFNPITAITIPIPYINPSASNQVGVYVDATNLHIFTVTNLSPYTETYITIRYIKS